MIAKLSGKKKSELHMPNQINESFKTQALRPYF
jgi:hypothetical protein